VLQKITSCKYNQGVTEHHNPLYVLNVNFFRLSVAKEDANFFPEITKPSPQITAPKVSYAKPPKSEPHHILLKPDSNNIYSFKENRFFLLNSIAFYGKFLFGTNETANGRTQT
jgi:hypothetical protein